jgi:hypothetical protein
MDLDYCTRLNQRYQGSMFSLRLSRHNHTFPCTTCFDLLWPSLGTDSLNNHPSFSSPYTGQCLHNGSVLYRYVVCVMPECYGMHETLNIKVKIFKYSNLLNGVPHSHSCRHHTVHTTEHKNNTSHTRRPTHKQNIRPQEESHAKPERTLAKHNLKIWQRNV